MFGIMNHLDVVVCKDADEASQKGFDYGSEFKAVEIEKVVVVEDGTQSHRSTVDLLFKDKDGNKYVVMLTGALLKSIPC